MSTLMEIEKAAIELSTEEQKKLLRFLLRVIPVGEEEMPTNGPQAGIEN